MFGRVGSAGRRDAGCTPIRGPRRLGESAHHGIEPGGGPSGPSGSCGDIGGGGGGMARTVGFLRRTAKNPMIATRMTTMRLILIQAGSPKMIDVKKLPPW